MEHFPAHQSTFFWSAVVPPSPPPPAPALFRTIFFACFPSFTLSALTNTIIKYCFPLSPLYTVSKNIKAQKVNST